MKKHLWAVCFSAALIAFTVYIALDTFVIPRVYNSNATELNTSMFSNISKTALNNSQSSSQSSSSASEQSSGSSKAVVSTDTSYSDDNISVTLTEYYENNTKIYAADIMLSSAEYLKTAFANDTYGKNVTATTSSTAQANNAVLAVNGDYYGVQESGYVIRNGVVYRGSAKGADVLCVYANGTMEIVSDGDFTADELVSKGVWQAFTFGPSLVENSSVTGKQSQNRYRYD